MDSNESNEDKIVDEAGKMEVSDVAHRDKSNEPEADKVGSEKMTLEESNESASTESPKAGPNEDTVGDFSLAVEACKEDEKINTPLTESETAEGEITTVGDKQNNAAVSDKDSETSEMEALELVSPETPNHDEDDVKNKDIESTNDAMDIDETCNVKQPEDHEKVSLGEKVSENAEKTNDFKDAEITKDPEVAENTQKVEAKSTENIKDIKVDVADVKEVQDTVKSESTAVIKDVKDKNEIKSDLDADTSIKRAEEVVKPLKIKKIKDNLEIVDDNQTKTEVLEKCKKPSKAEVTKDIKEALESLENKKIVSPVKNNKVLRDVKGAKDAKETKEAKNVENIKKAEVVMSMSLREGKRKRRNTTTPFEGNSPPAEEEQQQNGSPSKRKLLVSNQNDRFCWRCHKESVEMQCSACPRSWHRRCMGGAPPLNVTDWLCSECTSIQQAENPESRSTTMAHLTIEQLVVMLRHVVERMRDQTGAEPFLKAVDLDEVPNYLEYVVNPMDLSLLESNVRAKMYASTDAFMADAKWIQHNCIVFNTYSSKLTNTAKQMLKVARQEVSEIEACPDCFAHGRNLPKPLPSWFVEPCRRPHPIVWAKLKGFPFWPAKAMPRLNAQGLVDVRFFGEHDRAWVSPKDIFLYSKEPPAGTPRKKKIEMEQCVKEVQDHVKKLERVFGEFKYAEQRVSYDPHDLKQIQIMLPNYDPVENKVINKKENPKAEAQTPAGNNKTAATKADKKSVNAKNAVAPSANGVAPNRPLPAVHRKPRKKRPLSPQPQEPPAVPTKSSKLSPEVAEKVVVVTPPKKTKSKSPPVATAASTPTAAKTSIVAASPTASEKTTPVANKTPSSDKVNANNSDKEVGKVASGNNNAQPAEATSNGNNVPTKQAIVPVKKIRPGVVKKIKLTKESPKTTEIPLRKPMVVVKTMNIGSKPTTVIHSMPNMNSYADSLESTPVKILGTTKKLISILPKKSPGMQPKLVNSKTIQIIQQDGKVVNRTIKRISMPVTKEAAKFPLVLAQPKDKSGNNDSSTSSGGNNNNNSSGGGKSMTSIPLSSSTSTATSAKKDQKALFNEINSSMSETAKQFSNGETEIKLNSAVSLIKHEPKDSTTASINMQPKLTIVRSTKPSKARKSFPNKPPSPQTSPQGSPVPTKPSSSDSANAAKQSAEKRSVFSTSNNSSPSTASSVVSSSSGPAYELPPPEAGPATAQIHRNSKDLANKMAQLIVDTIKDAAEGNATGAVDHNEATIYFLKLKMERMKWKHDQEMNELKQSNDAKIRELKATLEAEQQRTLENARREAEIDKKRSIEETKRKQWCVVCGREAMFFCCWNTAYCDYPCQQKHWAAHVNNCAQKNPPSSQSSSSPSSCASSPPPQTQKLNSVKQQLMPKLVNTKPQQQSIPVMKKAASASST